MPPRLSLRSKRYGPICLSTRLLPHCHDTRFSAPGKKLSATQTHGNLQNRATPWAWPQLRAGAQSQSRGLEPLLQRAQQGQRACVAARTATPQVQATRSLARAAAGNKQVAGTAKRPATGKKQETSSLARADAGAEQGTGLCARADAGAEQGTVTVVRADAGAKQGTGTVVRTDAGVCELTG